MVEGLLGADLLGFQRRADATNFLRACRRAVGLITKGSTVRVDEPGGPREVRAAAFPISIDAAGLAEIARRDDVGKRTKEIREALGEPSLTLLGVDRLDYTKGILHRLRAYGELLGDGRLGPRPVLVQVASPSRERVEAYQTLRDEVEVMVGRINGQYGEVGYHPVHYLHQSYPREEMAALYLAADVMLVTPLRDGMNLVAKEYVASRYDEGGALVLSEFTGAADELAGAFLVNPHDIEGLKNTIVRAATATPPARPGAGCARCGGGCASTTWPAGRPASSTRCAATGTRRSPRTGPIWPAELVRTGPHRGGQAARPIIRFRARRAISAQLPVRAARGGGAAGGAGAGSEAGAPGRRPCPPAAHGPRGCAARGAAGRRT